MIRFRILRPKQTREKGVSSQGTEEGYIKSILFSVLHPPSSHLLFFFSFYTMITNEPSPYGSVVHDGFERHYQTHHCEQAPLLINEKRSSSITFHSPSNRKQHLLMAAWAFIVMAASYFVLTHSPTPASVFTYSKCFTAAEKGERIH